MNVKRPNSDVVAMQRVETEIGRGRIHPYRNVVGEACILCDLRNSDRVLFPYYDGPISHRNFRDWLSDFIWTTEAVLLREEERKRILQVLSGRSLRSKVNDLKDPELLRVIEGDPVLTTVWEYMNLNRFRTEWALPSLWEALNTFGKTRALLVRGAHRFPGGAATLGRMLRHHTDLLMRLGIRVTIPRSNKVVLEWIGEPGIDTHSGSAPADAQLVKEPTLEGEGKATLAQLKARRSQRNQPYPGDSPRE